MSAPPTDDEEELVAPLRAGDLDRAATGILTRYGDEVYGFLLYVARDRGAADDVFSQVVEDLWKGLAGFAYRSSVRTWLYVLARNALSRYARSPWNRASRRVGPSSLDSLAQELASRSGGVSQASEQIERLRAALSEDDRALLVLRVDRNLPWRDVARAFLEDQDSDEATLAREAARLRKRFQLVKERIRSELRGPPGG